MNFASDNGAGVAPAILEAIVASSRVNAPAYGADAFTARAEALLSEVFQKQVAAFLVPTGTAANALALSALVRPWEAIFCHEESHVHDDECGAPEFFAAGAKLVGIPGLAGKITPEVFGETLARYPRGLVKASQPGALSLSQATEAGTLYTVAEIESLASLAHEAGIGVHMDGARFANAIVALNATPAEMTWRAGVDALSFGATKNGALACEAVVFFDPTEPRNSPFNASAAVTPCPRDASSARKWRPISRMACGSTNARRANAAASSLAEGLLRAPGVRRAWPTEVNEVFVVAPRVARRSLARAGAKFHDWPTRALASELAPGPEETLLRLVTSFETSRAEIEALVAVAQP